MTRTTAAVFLVAVVQLATVYASLDWLDAVIVDNYNKAELQGPPTLDRGQAEVLPPPPPVNEAAKYARYIVHYSLWGSLAHISWQPKTTGLPIARVYLISDGPLGKSSGVPYFVMTFRDDNVHDIIKDPRASLTCSLAQSNYCRNNGFDPEDPRCAQITLIGDLLFIPNTTVEWEVAKTAVYARHPVVKTWPNTHEWKFAKLVIKRISLVNYFGGNKYPSIASYFAANPDVYSEENPMLEMNFY